MSEGEVVEQLVEFTNILLVGVSLIFSIVSAYVVALNYFIGSSNLMARLGSFAFITLVEVRPSALPAIDEVKDRVSQFFTGMGLGC